MIPILLLSCANPVDYNGMFDGPSYISVLSPEDFDRYHAPVGFVSNSRSGRIIPIDLTHMGPLSDQMAAPFLRARGIATGAQRQLEKNLVYENEAGHLRMLIHDPFHQQIVDIPYLQEDNVTEPQVSSVQFLDNDASGDQSEIIDLWAQTGFATTEEWTLTYNGDFWQVSGSRSGLQPDAFFDTPYSSRNQEIMGTIQGTASKGDQLVFSVDTGITELNLTGIPLSFIQLGSDIAVSLWDPDLERGAIALISIATKEEIAYFVAPEGVQPWKLQAYNDQIFVSDAKSPRIFQFDLSSTWVPIGTTDIVQDIKSIDDKLFVATTHEIAKYDITNGSWIDLNPLDSSRTGIELSFTIESFSQNSQNVTFPSTQNGASIQEEALLVSFQTGEIGLLQTSTGCLITSSIGPSITEGSFSNSYAVSFIDEGLASNPALQEDPLTAQSIQIHPCGGIAQEENWSITYDEVAGNWIVEGSLSGVQENRATYFHRYTSDQGVISFSLVEGSLPASDGDRFTFQVQSNILLFSSVLNTQGRSEALEIPKAATFYTEDERPIAVVPIQNSDIVIKIDIEDWVITGIWN